MGRRGESGLPGRRYLPQVLRRLSVRTVEPVEITTGRLAFSLLVGEPPEVTRKRRRRFRCS